MDHRSAATSTERDCNENMSLDQNYFGRKNPLELKISVVGESKAANFENY